MLRASQSIEELVLRARMRLHMTQRELADAVGTSLRTVARWEARESTPADFHFHRLAARLHPVDPDLAHDAAVRGGTALEALGLVKPLPSPPPVVNDPAPIVTAPARVPPPAPPPPPLPAHLLVDSVVYAVGRALEAYDGALITLERERIAVEATFVRARELRLASEDAAEVFERTKAPAPPPELAPSSEAPPASPPGAPSKRAKPK